MHKPNKSTPYLTRKSDVVVQLQTATRINNNNNIRHEDRGSKFQQDT